MIRKQLRAFIEDFNAYKNYHGKSFIMTLLNINLYVNLNYRLSTLFFYHKCFLISKIFWIVNRIIYSIDIDPGATISGGFVIIHGVGIVIGRNVKILGPIKIYHGVTLGGNRNKQEIVSILDKEVLIDQPVIHSNVTIGIHSSILGPVVIGKNAIIGTGAIVTKNVPCNSLCVKVNTILEK